MSVEVTRRGASSLREGVRAGLPLAACAVILAVLGLTPSLTWIPEVPLIAAGVLVPAVFMAMAGHRAGGRSGGIWPGSVAGGLAGAIGGGVGGVMYVLFGKPFLNVAVGLVLGMAGGALVGALAAWARRD